VGRLREPLNALKRANAIILTKGNAEQNSKTKKQIQGITPTPIYTTETNAEIGKYKNGKWVAETPKDTPYVFCGIADPDSFKSLLEKEHISTTHFRAFADHHHYTERNVQALTEEIQKSQCSTILTTEKDIVKLPPSFLSQFKVYLLKYGLSCDLNEVLS
jgi:tetraacyldisaccharide 4'-kinase